VERTIPAFGLCVLLGIAWLLSSHRHRISMRIVVGGMLMQFLMALLVLRSDVGQSIFQSIGDLFTKLLDCVDQGAGFVFGNGAVQTPTKDDSRQQRPQPTKSTSWPSKSSRQSSSFRH